MKIKKHQLLFLSLFAVIAFFFAMFSFSHANDLSYNLRGRILLKVEDHGQLWYLNQDNLQAYELKKNNYQEVLADLAIGITNENLHKIARDENIIDPDLDSDNDGYLDKTELHFGYDPYGAGRWNRDLKLAENLAGYFLLQVEDRGRLWYLHPEKLKRYEIRQDNFQEFFEGMVLGINNENFSNILLANERVDWGSKNCQNAECFMQAFQVCSPIVYKMILNEDFILEYEILGEEEGRCRMKSQFLANPENTWENKEMNCVYDYKNNNISQAFLSVFEDEDANCSGPLFDLFKGNNNGVE